MKIPIVIGVSGHRDLRNEDIPRLRELVAQELKSLIDACPHSEFTMLNSLAAGADTLCAQEALRLGMKLVCPLPRAPESYRSDFSPEEARVFDELLSSAAQVFTAPCTEASPESDDACVLRHFGYRQAGIYVAEHSHVLLALWDGSEEKPDGCGTAEAVGFMLRGRSAFKAANDGAVIHISTPRQRSDSQFDIGVRLIENQPGSLKAVLRETDGFNARAEKLSSEDTGARSLVPSEDLEGADERLISIAGLNRTAAAIARAAQEKYLRAMKTFSLFGVLLVLFFLLYDEGDADIFLIFYGVLLGVYIMACLAVNRANDHGRYLETRMLAESLRVQFYICASGSSYNVGDGFTWTQKDETTWIKAAVSAMLIGPETQRRIPDDVIKKAWIDGQLDYHLKAGERDARKNRRHEKTARVMIFTAVALFFAVLLFELFGKALMEHSLFTSESLGFMLPHAGSSVTLRSLLKILLGIGSCVTAFLSEYYGRLSFERKSLDHEKMSRLFAAASEQYYDVRMSHAELFRALAREELIENGNWYSYCRENKPSFNV